MLMTPRPPRYTNGSPCSSRTSANVQHNCGYRTCVCPIERRMSAAADILSLVAQPCSAAATPSSPLPRQCQNAPCPACLYIREPHSACRPGDPTIERDGTRVDAFRGQSFLGFDSLRALSPAAAASASGPTPALRSVASDHVSPFWSGSRTMGRMSVREKCWTER